LEGDVGKPSRINIRGEIFEAIVLRVETFDEQGRPETLTMIPEERVVELSQNPRDNHFLVVYASKQSVGPNPKLAE
jgi:hypothetical protein